MANTAITIRKSFLKHQQRTLQKAAEILFTTFDQPNIARQRDEFYREKSAKLVEVSARLPQRFGRLRTVKQNWDVEVNGTRDKRFIGPRAWLTTRFCQPAASEEFALAKAEPAQSL